MITNQLYLRSESAWEAVARGAEVISSKMMLVHEAYKGKPCYMPVRTAVWTKLQPKLRHSGDGPAIMVLNAHLTGGRYEDQCFLQRLTQERKRQAERVLKIYTRERGARDAGIFVGDFNASAEDTRTSAEDPTVVYFNSVIWRTNTVKANAKKQGLSEEGAKKSFFEYMSAPFVVVRDHGWTFAYNEEQIGSTSTFGHLVDHMAVSDSTHISVLAKERVLTCKSPPEQQAAPAMEQHGEPTQEHPTVLGLSDHNGVKVTFGTTGLFSESSWYAGGPPPRTSADAEIEAWAAARKRRREAQEATPKAQPKKSDTGADEGADASASKHGGSHYQVLLIQADGHPAVRVIAQPTPDAQRLGEIPSSQIALCTDEKGDFLRVRWRSLDGWVGMKNAKAAPAFAGMPSTIPDGQGEKEVAGQDYPVVLRQADGHATVRVYTEPTTDSALVGQVPSGEQARCTDHRGDFLRICWGELEGWVGLRNTDSVEACVAKRAESKTD